MPSVYDFQVQMASGESKSLAEFRDQVMLIVNTASKCGFNPRDKWLETSYALTTTPESLEKDIEAVLHR